MVTERVFLTVYRLPDDMKSIPIGVQSFTKVRDLDLYYVDKTGLIDSILNDAGTEVFLFTRPRRFGKSLNLSMLDAYLNIRYKGNTWFDGLSISERRPDDPLKNSFPVICLDMKDLNVEDYDRFVNSFRKKLATLYFQYDYLDGSPKLKSLYQKRYSDVMEERSDEEDLTNSILYLSQMLELYHGVKPIILIDEYDNPLNSSYGLDSHGKILGFLKRLYSSAFKGGAARTSVITGVMQVSKESIFSGLNNISVNNVFSTESDEMFGFTSDEVNQLCIDYGHPEKFEEARQWYDGYVFGDSEIYNPWSVLNYVKSGFIPDEYWAGTSGNSIIRTLLDRADAAVFDDLKVLGEGGSISRKIDTRISFAEMEDVNGIYSVMTLSGYLKAVPSGKNYLLSIPNMEMYRVFGRMVAAGFDNRIVDVLDTFCYSVTDGDADGISDSLSSLLMSVLSSRILDHEHSYQAFVAGMLLTLCGRYSMFADGERGKGYYDILLKANRSSDRHIIMELKRSDPNADDDTMEELSLTAIQQIREREYFHGLKGEVLMYGISVRGKDVVVSSETVSL